MVIKKGSRVYTVWKIYIKCMKLENYINHYLEDQDRKRMQGKISLKKAWVTDMHMI